MQYDQNGSSSRSSHQPETNNSNVKLYRPYFSPVEIEHMSAKQRGKLSVNREERLRQQACGFIDAVGARCGFPRKTIATAQTMYMRFHLFFPYRDFRYMEVCLSTLYVSSKLHDTLKKPREIILASYPLRFPHLVKKPSASSSRDGGSGSAGAGGGGGGGGTLDMASVDPRELEAERGRVLGIERLVLEGVCFMFGVEGMEGVVRIARGLNLDKSMTQAAWRMHVDCYRTLSPLTHPSHITALGSIYACALLSLGSSRPTSTSLEDGEGREWKRIIDLLGHDGSWEGRWSASADDVDRVAHSLIDLHMTILATPPSEAQHSLAPSPSSPLEPPGGASSRVRNGADNTIGNTAFRLSSYWTLEMLIDLKVWLREQRPSAAPTGVAAMEEAILDGVLSGEALFGAVSAEQSTRDQGARLGKNEGTVRFVWGDDVVAGA